MEGDTYVAMLKKKLIHLTDLDVSSDRKADKIFTPYIVEGNEKKKINFEKSTEVYHSILDTLSTSTHLYFDIKKSNDAILLFTGGGYAGKIWSLVLLNKETLNIKNIEFSHKEESSSYGSKIIEPEFKEQFIGKSLSFEESSLGLTQSNIKIIKGNSQVDGITGATSTSKGAIIMINHEIIYFKGLLK